MVKHTSFFTDKDGYLILPEYLPLGNYRIEEVAAPDGYAVNQNHVTFAVDTNTAYEIHGETQEVIITMDYVDEPVVGELTVEKKGEVLEDYGDGNFIYRERGLAGAEFKVYAAEDIYTNDYQTDETGKRYKYYSDGDLVKTLVTGKSGMATLSNLPLGRYKIVETKAPDGYVLNEEEQTVTFVYVDDRTPVIYQSNTFTNDRQKAKLSVEKLDGETGLPIAGTAFGLYNAEDVENVDGTVIVEADTLLETAVSDTNGMVTFQMDLPFGEYYAKEIEAPLGYVSSDEIVEFAFEYKGQETKIVELSHEFENFPTTCEITKTDLTSGAELSGATLSVIDRDGNAVDSWTSKADEPHVIKRLHVGETYTLREEFAPYGYLQAEEIQFTVEDTEEIQELEMKDAVPTGTIVINKDGEFLSDVALAKGQWYDFLFRYFRKNLAGVEFEVYAAGDIVSPDGLEEIYYEEDELVETIVTNDKGIAVLEGLPLGKYYLVETKTLEGFVLDDTPIEADVSYVDQYTPIVYAGMNVFNERQKVEIVIIKTDSETDEPLSGAVFGLYAKDDMVNAEGTVVVQKDTLIEKGSDWWGWHLYHI